MALRDTFPNVGAVHIDLRFVDHNGIAPSAQRHTLYPAARAFFRFACPCAECDGDFNLAPAVNSLVQENDRSRRATDRAVRGQLNCEGVRARDRASSRPCTIELHYQLTAGPKIVT
jgi:hypothetical protein